MFKKLTYGSSETIRETTFDFRLYKNLYLPEHKTSIDKAFLEWFIGFFEGDGSFIVSRPKVGSHRLFFTLTQNEIQVLHRLRTKLGFGKVQKHGKYFRFVVTKRGDVDRLIHLFNGNLILKKTNERFKALLAARNELHTEKVYYKGPCQPIQFLKSGWLSGFIDAEGCFYLERKETSKSFHVKCMMLIDQKDELEILEQIQNELESAGFIECRKNSTNYRYRVSSILIFEKHVFPYLNKYLLRTIKKRVSLARFKKMVNYRISRKDLPWEGKVLERIKRLFKKLEK